MSDLDSIKEKANSELLGMGIRTQGPEDSDPHDIQAALDKLQNLIRNINFQPGLQTVYYQPGQADPYDTKIKDDGLVAEEIVENVNPKKRLFCLGITHPNKPNQVYHATITTPLVPTEGKIEEVLITRESENPEEEPKEAKISPDQATSSDLKMLQEFSKALSARLAAQKS